MSSVFKKENMYLLVWLIGTHTYIHAYIHTYIHAYIHTYT